MEPTRTADVVALATENGVRHVLMIRRGWPPYQDHWALPGGHVDTGESSLHAACRELREETGLAVPTANLAHVGTYDTPGRDPRGRYVSQAYTVALETPLEVEGNDDADDARWIPLGELAALPLAFDHRHIICDSLALHTQELVDNHDQATGQAAGTTPRTAPSSPTPLTDVEPDPVLTRLEYLRAHALEDSTPMGAARDALATLVLAVHDWCVLHLELDGCCMRCGDPWPCEDRRNLVNALIPEATETCG